MTAQDKMLIGVNAKSYPQFVFKHRPDSDNTKKIFTENGLWFSSPSLFNDPYDCNTPINNSSSIDEINSWLKKVGVSDADRNRFATELQKNPNANKEKTEKAISELGVCCFSTMDNSILQWSHYSDYHKGICLKFDILEDLDLFLIPVIVSYRKTMQHYNHFTQSNNIIEYLIRPKFHEWSYESEIRIVKTAQNIQNNGGNRAFRFKDNALKEVIFGAKASESTINKYKKLCSDNNKKHVKFFKMELGSDVHYELIKQPI